jgi:hypothetical protein
MAEGRQDEVEGVVEGAVEGTARGIFVATAAESFCDGGDVDGSTFAAKTESHAVVGELAEKDGDVDTGDSDGVVDEALAIFFCGSGSSEVTLRDPHPGEATFAVEI